MKKCLVSACLLGMPCRYDGKSVPHFDTAFFEERGVMPIPVCPEVMGGLSTPRPPAEIQRRRVISTEGCDVTDAFLRGAALARRTAIEYGCTVALLKERSPSCGKGLVYDGSFSGTLTRGDGITAACLMQAGISVFGESETDALFEFLKK